MINLIVMCVGVWGMCVGCVGGWVEVGGCGCVGGGMGGRRGKGEEGGRG